MDGTRRVVLLADGTKAKADAETINIRMIRTKERMVGVCIIILVADFKVKNTGTVCILVNSVRILDDNATRMMMATERER